jgi:hypothetical protein
MRGCSTFEATTQLDDPEWHESKYLAIEEVLARLRGVGKRSTVCLSGGAVQVTATTLRAAIRRLTAEGEIPDRLVLKIWRRNGSEATLSVEKLNSRVEVMVRVESRSDVEAFGLLAAVRERLARTSSGTEILIQADESRFGRVQKVARKVNGSAWFVALTVALVAGLILSALHLVT